MCQTSSASPKKSYNQSYPSRSRLDNQSKQPLSHKNNHLPHLHPLQIEPMNARVILTKPGPLLAQKPARLFTNKLNSFLQRNFAL